MVPDELHLNLPEMASISPKHFHPQQAIPILESPDIVACQSMCLVRNWKELCDLWLTSYDQSAMSDITTTECIGNRFRSALVRARDASTESLQMLWNSGTGPEV